MASTNLPKRPRPVLPIIWAACTASYIAITVAEFLAGKTVYGFIWAGCSMIWICYTLPTSIRTYQSRVKTWQMKVDLLRRLDEIDEMRAFHRSLWERQSTKDGAA